MTSDSKLSPPEIPSQSPTSWPSLLRPYTSPDTGRSILELVVTAVPFVVLWVGCWLASSHGFWWLSLLLALPASGFLLRLFMIQHDCGHRAFFRSRRLNDWVGRIIGVLTVTPYDYWRQRHAIHHASSGDLGRRGMGDIDTLTVREYRELSRLGRLRYRLYRHPLVLFGVGPGVQFLLLQRLPFGQMRGGWRPWLSTQGTNAGIAALVIALVLLIGVKDFLTVHMPIVLLAAATGVWLFYLQHQFENTVWSESKDWNFQQAALYGSSHYVLPPLLQWFTANIGLHHVHHLMSRIPYYRLPSVLRDYPEIARIGRMSIRESLRTPRLALWDEEKRRLVGFSTLRERT
ncbi:MAG: fatty acid desaturase [Beijerinckiaceae bacterium]